MIKHADNQTVRCHECDNQVFVPAMLHKQKALCPRCGYVLTRKNIYAIERIVAFASSALLCLVLSISFRFLGFSASGQEQNISIIGGLQVLIEQQYILLAIVQFTAIIIIPALILIGILYLLIPVLFNTQVLASKFIIKWIYRLIPWSMAEIFLVGVLVSLTKISSMADIILGPAFYSYIGFTIFITLTFINMDKQQLLMLFNATEIQHKPLPASISIQRTWALLFTSVLLYIPANLLPIMHTRLLGTEEPNTILGGIIVLWQHGSYPIAIIIFIASVLVPIGKLFILMWLNYSVQKRLKIKQNERIFWYRVTEFIGRWSMIDVFVVAVLVSLIQLGNTMSVYPGPAALAFCGVVVTTMFSAITFDTKLIWNESSK